MNKLIILLNSILLFHIKNISHSAHYSLHISVFQFSCPLEKMASIYRGIQKNTRIQLKGDQNIRMMLSFDTVRNDGEFVKLNSENS